MIAKPKGANEDSNSEEEKSEEFLNFERGMKAILSLTPEEALKVREKVPEPKSKKRKRKPRTN